MKDPSPQVENGHIRIANPIWIALMKFKLSDYERRVLMAVIYRTYGFNKPSAKITNKQLVKDTGISRQNVNKTLNLLEEKKLVVRTDYKIKFNKVYTQWKSCSPSRLQKKCSPSRLQSESVQTTVVVQPDYTDRCVKTPLKDNTKNKRKIEKRKNFKKPTIEELDEYIAEKGYAIDAEYFWHYYEARGWKLKNGPMKSWKSALVTFEKNNKRWADERNGIQQGATEVERDWHKLSESAFAAKYGEGDINRGNDVWLSTAKKLGKL